MGRLVKEIYDCKLNTLIKSVVFIVFKDYFPHFVRVKENTSQYNISRQREKRTYRGYNARTKESVSCVR